MEKIQKALERARQERDRTRKTAPAGAIVDGLEPSPQDTPPSVGSEAITYESTRIHEASKDALESHRVVSGMTHPELVDTYRVLRTQVLHKLSAGGHKALAITSTGRGAGKTLTSINLAISLASRVSNTVLLVDLDLRRPSVHRYLEFAPEKGLSDYLINGTRLASCLVNPGIDRLVVLPAGGAVQGSSELLSAPKMLALIDELKARYNDRIVLYDLPPLFLADDALAFLRQVDSCLLVIEDGKSRKDDVQRALELLQGCNLIGTVLNKSSESTGIAYY